MDVTIVDADISYPPTSGKRLRTLNLMLPLAKRHRITYIGRDSTPSESGKAVEFLGDHGIRAILVDEPIARKRGPEFYLRLAGNMLSPLPYSAASHATPGMRAAVAAHRASNPVDLMQIEWVGYDYCRDGLDVPAVLQAHNVESLIWRRYAETEPSRLKRTYIRDQYRKFVAFERRVFAGMDRVVAVSETDAQLAREMYGATNIAVVDNGVDVDYFAAVPRHAPSESPAILFLGALDWRPNADAVDQLLGAVFPLIRARRPDATLMIVGRRPSPALVERAAATPGVELHADVPDVRPYMSNSAVMTVPLRIGGGSRLKILEALAARLPVVSTAVGAEGLELADGTHLTIADDAEAMAAALIAAIDRPEAANAQAEAGRAAVSARYGWPMLADRLEQVWEEAARSHRDGHAQSKQSRAA